jgi:hypothetical protein
VVSDFKQICHLAHKYHFEGVNIDFSLPHAFSTYECKQLLGQLNLKPVAFGLPVKLFDSQKEFEESLPEFESQAKRAGEIGCHLTLCYIPPFSLDLNFNDRFIQTSNRLRDIKYILERYNIKIGF